MPIADEKHSDSISSYSAPSDSNNGAGRRTFPPYRRVDGYVEVSKDNKAFRFPCYKIPGQKMCIKDGTIREKMFQTRDGREHLVQYV